MTRTTILGCAVLATLAAPAAGQDTAATEAPANTAACPVAEFTMGVRFQQQSAEIRALQLQAYNIASSRPPPIPPGWRSSPTWTKR